MKSFARRVLIVAESETNHAEFTKILEGSFGLRERSGSFDFELHRATGRRAAVEFLSTEVHAGRSIGAAFVDLRTSSEGDGVLAAEELWNVDPNLQIVICTESSDDIWARIRDHLGASDRLLILKKPSAEIEIVQLAISLCEKRRLLDESLRTVQSLESVVLEQAAELTAANENAETLIQSIPSALVRLDAAGRVVSWNAVASELFGVPEGAALGAAFCDLPIPWVDGDETCLFVAGAQLSSPKHAEVQMESEFGQVCTLDLRLCPIHGASDSGARLLVANDTTRQKQLQSQLDQAQRLESVGQLAAGVAHEINTPMQYVGDNVRYVAKTFERMASLLECLPAVADETVTDETLLETCRGARGTVALKKVRSALEQVPEALKDSIQGVEAVSRIVAAMKELSHPGSDSYVQTDINHVVDSIITVARNEWKYVSDVETELAENLPSVPAYSSELNQALLNIIVNAAHAIHDRVDRGDFEKGRIGISTRLSGDFVVVTIQDNGGGIPYHIQARVFDPFFTTKEVGKGTGQGLAIARSVIVNKHGGVLSFDVDPGEGTTFSIRLPLNPVEAGGGTNLGLAASGMES